MTHDELRDVVAKMLSGIVASRGPAEQTFTEWLFEQADRIMALGIGGGRRESLVRDARNDCLLNSEDDMMPITLRAAWRAVMDKLDAALASPQKPLPLTAEELDTLRDMEDAEAHPVEPPEGDAP